jgi:hypothetical protein
MSAPADTDIGCTPPKKPVLGDRNYLNFAPLTRDEAIKHGFTRVPAGKDVLHLPHEKWVGPNGYWEAVYDKEAGKLVTDPETIGTFNYVPESESWTGHFLYDILPWSYYGNPDFPGWPYPRFPEPVVATPPIPPAPSISSGELTDHGYSTIFGGPGE